MNKKKVLLFYPPNKRSVAIETVCKAVKEAGHEIVILTLSERGAFHEAMEKEGIETLTYEVPRKPSWKFFYKHTRNIISFCKKRKIDFVWSHLQEASLSALLAQKFIKAKVIVFRHHAESAFYAEMGEKFGMTRNANEVKLDKLINRMAKAIVIPSSGVWLSMEKYEGVDMRKVKLIPYIYNFSKYQKPELVQTATIRNSNSCQLMLIMVSRMIATKQHRPVFDIVNKLHKQGLSIKMLVMDDGPLKPELEKMVNDNQLQDNIIFTGFRTDFINYMAAADLLIHPSLTEASNNVVKEMGLLQKGVAVCKDVGDFNEYICEGENGFFLDANNLERSLEEVIRKAYQQPEQLKEMGIALNKKVIEFFSDTAANRQPYLDLLK